MSTNFINPTNVPSNHPPIHALTSKKSYDSALDLLINDDPDDDDTNASEIKTKTHIKMTKTNRPKSIAVENDIDTEKTREVMGGLGLDQGVELVLKKEVKEVVKGDTGRHPLLVSILNLPWTRQDYLEKVFRLLSLNCPPRSLDAIALGVDDLLSH